MRLKRLELGGASGPESGWVEGVARVSFLPPKSFIIEGSSFEFRASQEGSVDLRDGDPV
jgi:hypothetical protein